MCDNLQKKHYRINQEDAPGCAHPHQADSEVTQLIIHKKNKRDGP